MCIAYRYNGDDRCGNNFILNNLLNIKTAVAMLEKTDKIYHY